MRFTRNPANIVTGLRIPCSLWMMAYPAFSIPFYVLYLICGFTDMIDGTVARKTNSCSLFGATLDSAADIVFTVAAFAKILPAIALPGWVMIWILIIAVVKVTSFVIIFLHSKNILSYHSPLNKLTGLLLFLMPLSVSFIDPGITSILICSIASISAVQELHRFHTAP